jgi:hypothetical protein
LYVLGGPSKAYKLLDDDSAIREKVSTTCCPGGAVIMVVHDTAVRATGDVDGDGSMICPVLEVNVPPAHTLWTVLTKVQFACHVVDVELDGVVNLRTRAMRSGMHPTSHSLEKGAKCVCLGGRDDGDGTARQEATAVIQ